MQIFKPVPYSTTEAFFRKLTTKRKLAGLGTTLSMSNDMMFGMALGGVAFLIMKKKGLLAAKAR